MLRKLFLLLLLAVVLSGVAVVWWIGQPLSMSKPTIEVEVKRGDSARTVVNTIVNEGAQVNPEWLYQYFKWSGKSQLIQAGTYELDAEDTPQSILEKMVAGSQITRTIILLEGWTFAEFRKQLNANSELKHDTKDMTDAQIMAALGKADKHPEGLFFPDTFIFDKGSSDLHVLKRSMNHMDEMLTAAWAEREENLPIKTPYEALILASIIEKETGVDADRFLVAGVFTNRLRIGMLLQTDPTVVYGVGDAFTGRITKRNLEADTPYNTYTRVGLPPTPIAMPSKKSILAALHPAKTKALFFVAKGNGSSHFSNSNADHERAVAYYLKGGGVAPRPSSGVIEE